MKTTRALAFSVAALAGFALGWRLAGRHIGRHKADLFSASRLKRMAALSYLAGQEGPEAIHVLRDYIAWEPSVALRRRAQRIVRRMSVNLRSGRAE